MQQKAVGSVSVYGFDNWLDISKEVKSTMGYKIQNSVSGSENSKQKKHSGEIPFYFIKSVQNSYEWSILKRKLKGYSYIHIGAIAIIFLLNFQGNIWKK